MKKNNGRNIVIGAIVTTLLATGGYVLAKNTIKGTKVKSIEEQAMEHAALPTPTMEKCIVYNDGSMRFFLDFPEEYGIEEEPYVEEREEDIDYIEIYHEDGTSEIIDYPILEQEKPLAKVKSPSK